MPMLRSLYKEIAVAYGVGLRLNFDYFILRLDLGMKAISPYYTTTEEHYPISNPNFKRDYALHFAVGLPFWFHSSEKPLYSFQTDYLAKGHLLIFYYLFSNRIDNRIYNIRDIFSFPI